MSRDELVAYGILAGIGVGSILVILWLGGVIA